MPYYIWAIIGILLVLLEMITPGFVVLWFGIGALFSAFFAFLGFGINIQLLAFIITSLILTICSRTIFQDVFMKKSPGASVATNVDALIGKEGIVVEKIEGSGNLGLVKVGGEVWSAKEVNDGVIEEGRKVQIIKIDGVKLIVKAL